jgi:nitrogen regulation protein NR(I)
MIPARILLVEDDPAIVMTLRRVLAAEGYEVVVENRGDAGLAKAKETPCDLVITDLRLPGMGGLEIVRELHRAQPQVPILLMTAYGSTETAIEATKSGAFDYLLKPFEIPEMIELVEKAVTTRRMISEPVELGGPVENANALVGNGRAMQAIYKEIGRVASKPVNVLIRGETGSGKELIARAIYQHSDRAKGPFVAINCAAIPETLLESELFGHERGAFTGAETRRIGRFEQADGGTIFLDEIGEMTPGTQVKLLRVLQEKAFQRLGGKESIPVDVRVIAATNRDLEAAIRDKHFREDLFYRLSVVVIQLPALRERREDIPDLVRFFLRKYAAELGVQNPSIHPDAVEYLRVQNWPGNVRELENAVRKGLLSAQGYTINPEHVRAVLSRTSAGLDTADRSLRQVVNDLLAAAQAGEIGGVHDQLLRTVEKELFARAIEQAHGNQAKAARWVGVSRLTMREKLIQFGLHPAQDPARTP